MTMTEAQTGSNGTGGTRSPEYFTGDKLKAVGSIPPAPTRESKGAGGLTLAARFRETLELIQGDPAPQGDDGHWYELADYGGKNTAIANAKALAKETQGEVIVKGRKSKGNEGDVDYRAATPDTTRAGELADLVADGAGTFEFAGRATGERSTLYARYVAA